MPVDWILHNMQYAQALAEWLRHYSSFETFSVTEAGRMLAHIPQFFQHNFRSM